ncbi:MAG: hypothetical protein A3G41_00085 [Elusimicrobia bacterium RIFCSPLOWO2_12_FULL_59_9]|nr:MAG: hypothetical protein A3G41_00085 [Elusimicrobia bacterium RIFCSPLOWO2_12_FULL_59_9]
MRPATHALIGGAATAALAPSLGWPASALFGLASVFIDVDHYLDFLYYNGGKSWSLRKAYLFHLRLTCHHHRKDFLVLNVLHTTEAFILILLLALWSGSLWLQAIWAGMIFHYLCDLSMMFRRRILHVRAHSLLEYWIRRRRLAQAGLSPDNPYLDTLKELQAGGNPSLIAQSSPSPRAAALPAKASGHIDSVVV